jgi:triosephosphate isomerase (TIM)
MKKVIANWKMLPETLAQAVEVGERVAAHMKDVSPEALSLVVCPPFIFMEEIARHIHGVADLGAQDVALTDAPAQTGEISAEQLISLGVQYVIVGHSERRWKLGESEEVIRAKLALALRHNLTPIVCLGERSREGSWQDELIAQTVATLEGLSSSQVSRCLFAYEPVWAISTNPDAKPDTPASAVHAMSVIRDVLTDRFQASHLSFLYGGSVTQKNAADFLARPEIGGVLVGGASVRPDEFIAILEAAAMVKPTEDL